MKGLVKIAIGAASGIAYGMLFAQKPGKELRQKLQTSETPAKDFIDELKQVGKESNTEIKNWAENSENFQKFMESAEITIDDFKNQAKNFTDEQKIIAKEKLEEVAENAHKAAEEIATKAKETGTRFKNKIEEGTAKIAKK